MNMPQGDRSRGSFRTGSDPVIGGGANAAQPGRFAEAGMAILDWQPDERPRERLLAQGPGALSDAELLAICLRTGVRGESAVDLARNLLTEHGGVRGLLTGDRHALLARKGLGAAKYSQLLAVAELGRR